jgi:antitoxin (DNA-binding transcriptional repressor) of toxin-antitoxin stability system
MSTVTLQDSQRDPLSLLQRVEAGESIVVTRGDRPVAEFRPVTHPSTVGRPYGLAAGHFVVPADFDAPLPADTLRGFEGD